MELTASKVCDMCDLLKPEVRALADEYIALATDGTPDWATDTTSFRAWEYTHIYQALNLKGNERICDVGSGNSIFPIWLKKKFPGITMICIDPGMDPRLANRIKHHGVDIEVRKEHFGPHLGSFDRLTCISVLEHIPPDDDLVLVRRMVEQLNPGGVLAITVDYDKIDNAWLGPPHGCRKYGQKLVWSRIINMAGLRLREGPEGKSFVFRFQAEVPGIRRYDCDYTSCAIILDK